MQCPDALLQRIAFHQSHHVANHGLCPVIPPHRCHCVRNDPPCGSLVIVISGTGAAADCVEIVMRPLGERKLLEALLQEASPLELLWLAMDCLRPP